MLGEKYLIVNADDFGASLGVNRGILECHTRGVVTSASLMVTGRAVREAVSMSHDHPSLSIGLHWDVWGEDEREFDLANLVAVREELQRQLDEFYHLLGRLPTHVDSHQHAHRSEGVMPEFLRIVEPLGLPVRGDGQVQWTGGFYGQWKYKKTDLKHVKVPFLRKMLATEVMVGWNEFSCHPGFVTPDYAAVYLDEREVEVRSLTDPRIREDIDQLGIRLRNYADFGQNLVTRAAATSDSIRSNPAR